MRSAHVAALALLVGCSSGVTVPEDRAPAGQPKETIGDVAPVGQRSTLVLVAAGVNPNDMVRAMTDLSGFVWASSGTKCEITWEIRGPFVIDRTEVETTGKLDALADQLERAAGLRGYVHDRIVYAFPRVDRLPWRGLGSLGGLPTKLYLNGDFSPFVLRHEFGHNLGLRHSRSREPEGDLLEYGDVSCLMGCGPDDYCVVCKDLLGWAPWPHVDGLYVDAAGVRRTVDEWRQVTRDNRLK